MSLIVEDGTGLANAESYISVADADTYFSNRGNAAWAALSTAQKEQDLRKATDYIGQVYRMRWNGTRVSGVQALDWPRAYVSRDDINYINGEGYVVINGYYYWPSDEVPTLVKNACAELAFRASVADLSPDIGQRVLREKVDVIEIEYADHGPQYATYRAIDNMLAPFLAAGSSGTFRKVVRA
jgi:hypothetical protein